MPIETKVSKASRWLPVQNLSGEKIPGYGIMKIADTDENPLGPQALVEGQVVFNVIKPNHRSEEEQDTTVHLINGPQPIPIDGFGVGTMDFPAQVLHEIEDPTYVGDRGGYKADSWKISTEEEAYSLIGHAVNTAGDDETDCVFAVGRLQTFKKRDATFVGTVSSSSTASTTPAAQDISQVAINAGIELDLANKRIVVGRAGSYRVDFCCSIKGDQPGVALILTIYKTPVTTPGVPATATAAAVPPVYGAPVATHITGFRTTNEATLVGGSYGESVLVSQGYENISIGSYIDLDDDEALDIRLSCGSGSPSVQVSSGIFNVARHGARLS